MVQTSQTGSFLGSTSSSNHSDYIGLIPSFQLCKSSLINKLRAVAMSVQNTGVTVCLLVLDRTALSLILVLLLPRTMHPSLPWTAVSGDASIVSVTRILSAVALFFEFCEVSSNACFSWRGMWPRCTKCARQACVFQSCFVSGGTYAGYQLVLVEAWYLMCVDIKSILSVIMRSCNAIITSCCYMTNMLPLA